MTFCVCACACMCVCVQWENQGKISSRWWSHALLLGEGKLGQGIQVKGKKAKTSQGDCYCEHLLSHGNALWSGCITTILHPITSWRWNMIAGVMFVSNQNLGENYGNKAGCWRELILGRRGQTLLKDSVLLWVQVIWGSKVMQLKDAKGSQTAEWLASWNGRGCHWVWEKWIPLTHGF